MLDYIIKGGTVVDGTGGAPFVGDVAVIGGKIAKIAPVIDEEAEKTIDATGLIVSPGFIDSHTHSDTIAFSGSAGENYLMQGVTTQIAGQCGSSPTPYFEDELADAKRSLPPEEYERWAAMAKTPTTFMQAAEKAQLGTNIAFLLGHGALRAQAMAYCPDAPNEEQLATMKATLKEAMDVGYLGYSTGLVYAPSAFGTAEELTELAKVMKPYNGIYATHMRNEGDKVLSCVKESIAVGENAGIPVMISHLKVIGKHNEGTSALLLDEIDAANKRGCTVYADQYPYNASSAPLSSQIPPKYFADGIATLLTRLKDKAFRQQVLYSIFNETEVFESSIYTAGFEGCLISGAPLTPEHVGKTLAQLAKEQNKEPMDAFADLLIDNNGSGQGIYFNQCTSDLMRIMAHPKVFCGSDWSDTVLPEDENKEGGCHPRCNASLVRRMELVRDFRLRSLEDCVKNLTSDTARAWGLSNTGVLKEGAAGDICIFDYDRLHATADYAHPYRRSTGIHYVFVNGVLAVDNGKLTGARAGKVIKRG